MDKKLIRTVESFKLMLVSMATGGGGDNGEFKKLRYELIGAPRIEKLIPRFVHVCRDLSEFWHYIKPKFPSYAPRREFLRGEFDPLLRMLEDESTTPCDTEITDAVRTVGSPHIQETWRKALERRMSDPEGAITSARTLLESTCKYILDSTGESYDESSELPKLYALTAKQLNLAPSQHSEQLFKQILGGCQTVVEGLGAMRNRHSDAHGKGKSLIKAAPRHAELAVNLAGTMATFILHTWQLNKKLGPR